MRILFEVFMIVILVIILSFSYATFVSAAYDSPELPPQQQQQLPFCDEEKTQQSNRNAGLLYVSTLDGKISALDILDDGQKKWTINTTPGPMISSSIQNLELTSNGQWIRMIPSLSGSIYKFDGESVEPISISADNLLRSSYKYSDDLVISDGTETITYGVSAHSGKIINECSMRKCINNTDIDTDSSGNGNDMPPNDTGSTINADSSIDDEVIVVRRKTQTVWAIEARTGEKRWNFSVGQHELVSVGSSGDCHSSSKNVTDVQEFLTNLDLRVIVPDGVICAVRKNAPHVILYKYKFDHPIVNVWKRDENNELKAIDLFQTVQGMWQYEGKSWTQSSIVDDSKESVADMKPSIYIGMFKQQLYIQESEQLRSHLAKEIGHTVDDRIVETSYAPIPWKPIDASSSELAQIEPDSNEDTSLVPVVPGEETALSKKNYTATAISVLYGTENINGNGFYLYAKSDDSAKCNKEETSTNKSDDVIGINVTDLDEDTDQFHQPHTLIKFVSLWYWWREIVLIVLSVLVFNVVLTQRKPSEPEVVVVERHVEIKVPATPGPIDNNFLLPAIEYQTKRSLSESNNSESDAEYKSRFQTDFDMLQCLGKGGFGVVFEVKNKIDDCNYAIKRIVLPERKESRDRVMREVKTLANCEHNNIVRYFQAWVESPPPGWQDREDQVWMDRYALSHSIDIDSPSADEPSKPHPWNVPQSNQVRSEVFNKNKLDFLISGLQTNECVNFDDVIWKTNFSSNDSQMKDNGYTDDDDDDSFIVFAADGNEEEKSSKMTNATGTDASTDDEDEHSQENTNSVFAPATPVHPCTSAKPPRHKKKLSFNYFVEFLVLQLASFVRYIEH